MDNLKRYNKWLYNYIDNVDITNIEWLNFDRNELNSFFNNNYYDEKERVFVVDGDFNVPFGLYYLTFDRFGYGGNYFLGVADNNIGKKTIVAVIVYLDEYYLFADQIIPVTYVSTVEVNSYFWNNGIYKKMCDQFVKIINPNQHLVVSKESEMGKLCGVVNNLDKALYNNGFSNKCIVDDYSIDNSLFRSLICNNKNILIKKKNF